MLTSTQNMDTLKIYILLRTTSNIHMEVVETWVKDVIEFQLNMFNLELKLK